MNSARSVFELLDPNSYEMVSAHHLNESPCPRRLHLAKPRRKVAIAIAFSIALVVLTGLFFYQTHAESASSASSMGATVDPSSGTIYLSAQAAAGASTTSRERPTPMLEMHIANNGLVLLEGARVISLSSSRIRVEMKWDSETFTWVIKTNSKTKFIAPNGAKATLANVRVGDTLTVTGMLIGGGTEPTIDADFVRDE